MTSPSSPSPPTIRFATQDDVPEILSLIHELAAYERAPASVHATIPSLLSTLTFPSTPTTGHAKTLLIYPPNPSSPSTSPRCAGFALYFTNYSTWRGAPGIYLEDLFVREEFRGKGYGRALLGRVAGEVGRMGGERLEWSVLRWNEGAVRFYEGVGAKMMGEWVGMRVEGVEALRRLEEGRSE